MKRDEYFKQREIQLGFKPQTEVVYNQNLPYSEHIDDESNHALAVIKASIAKVVLSGELRPGLSYWASQLIRYVRLYGLKFSKEDHVLFIKLVYEVITIPDLESLLVDQLCSVLTKLLKKRELLKREDLQLDWMPLYKLTERLAYSKVEPMGLEWIPTTVDSKIRGMVRACRTYFPPFTTQSMLDEWRPLLCPFDVVMGKAVKYLDTFLPTLAYTEEESSVSWKLWIDEFLLLWKSVRNGPSWEKNFVNLFARVAHNNIGSIDWSDYVNPLFTRMLRALNLPVGKLQQTTALASQLPIESSCLWVVSMLGGPLSKTILTKLKLLLEATETYFHPSNLGKWSVNLFQFIQHITNKFVNRVYRERYKVICWEPKVPMTHLIQDEDIEEFVKILQPVSVLALYSKLGAGVSAKVLQNLAYLKPDMILPSILDKTYVALDTLTEPHQVRACLTALSCVISPGISGYPETRKHIIPLLFQCLPALDPNDLPKSTVAFQFISTCMTMIPLVDCSAAVEYKPDLGEDIKEVCYMTTQFEDFALQFFDRCFVLLESLNQGNETHFSGSSSDGDLLITQSEATCGVILVTASAILLQQTSKPIYKLCLEKLFRFASTHIFEGHVAMSTAATLFAVGTKANPAEGFSAFIPYYCNSVMEYFEENSDAKNYEKIDKQLMWDLKILSETCHIGTKHLLKYKDMLFDVADKTVEMMAKDAYEAAVRIVKFCIRGWSIYYTCDRKSVAHSFDQDPSKYLAIDDWGATMSPWHVHMSWHVPSEAELEAAFVALERFLEPALQHLSDFSNGVKELSKEELHKYLYVVKELIRECYLLLPVETEDLINVEDETTVPLRSWPVRIIETLHFYETVLSKNNRREIRGRIFSIVSATLQKVRLSREDDVESVCSIIDIYSHCFLMHEQLKSEFDQHWKVFAAYKAAMKNPFQSHKKRDRFSHIDRTVLQQRMRILAVERSFYTSMHQSIMLDLISLSTSHYMKVRGNAQALFFHGLSLVPHPCYKRYLPLILEKFEKTKSVDHQEFKGALYLLIGKSNCRSFLGCYQKWDAVRSVWPALINAPHSDKPSITKLYEKLALKIQAHFVSLAIHIHVSGGARQSALDMLKTKSLPSVETFDATQIARIGEENIKRNSTNNLFLYNALVDSLVDLYESGQLTWRYSELVLGMLSLMLRHDVDIPVRLSSLFTTLLVDDAISVRTLAVGCIGSITKQQKRKHVVEMLSVEEISLKPVLATDVNPGDRDDNDWHQYNPDDVPNTEKKFKSIRFIDKTHWGYYSWPKSLKTYAASELQPKLDRNRDDLSPGEVPLYDHFTDETFVRQVIDYLCLENEKGKDKFDDKKMDMFRGLFRNFGDTFVPYFKPHILRLVEDKQESHQRCSAEVIAGMVMGSKHWPFHKVNTMWSWLIPALHTAVSNISAETLKDWDCTFNHIVQNRDPRRIHWVLDFLVRELALPSSSALVESSKLYVLQGGIHQQEWRVPLLLERVLQHVEPMLGHPYKNIRNRIGSVIASIFLYDVQLMGCSQNASRTPSIDEFVQRIMPRMDLLLSEETPPLSNTSSHSSVGGFAEPSTSTDVLDEFTVPMPIGSETELSEIESLPAEVIEKLQKNLKKILPSGSTMPEVTSLSEMQDQLSATLLPLLKLHEREACEGIRTPVEDSGPMQVDNDYSRNENIRVFKTIMKWIVSAQRSTLQPFKPTFLHLLPLICKMHPVDQQSVDEELHRDSRLCLSCIAQSFVNDEDVVKVIETIENIVSNKSWHARHTVLIYIQVFGYSNLFSVTTNKEVTASLQRIILNLLQDEQYEVCRMAGVTLSGLIQCKIIPLDDELLSTGQKLCRTKLKRKKPAADGSESFQDDDYQKRLLKRHAGVLILSACVLSAPYTVPEWLPGVVMCLSDHLHDPQPIQGTIKRTLSDFRRTHHDSWHEDKQKFTSDELAILTDLLVSPSYYA